MTGFRVSPMPTETAAAVWNGGLDIHGMPPEIAVSDGIGVPCRHCLQDVSAGDRYLILAYRPFPKAQPYAETGPIFLHADPCQAYAGGGAMPPRYKAGEARILRGYDHNHRIVYGTGKVVDPDEISGYATELLKREDVAYVHVRSSTNNCFAFRIDRGSVET